MKDYKLISLCKPLWHKDKKLPCVLDLVQWCVMCKCHYLSHVHCQPVVTPNIHQLGHWCHFYNSAQYQQQKQKKGPKRVGGQSGIVVTRRHCAS